MEYIRKQEEVMVVLFLPFLNKNAWQKVSCPEIGLHVKSVNMDKIIISKIAEPNYQLVFF